jgi:hypothetical protein
MYGFRDLIETAEAASPFYIRRSIFGGLIETAESLNKFLQHYLYTER